MSDFDLRGLWQGSTPEGPSVDPEAVKTQARAFEQKIRRRNLVEWTAAALVVVSFGGRAVYADDWVVVAGNVLVALAALFIAVYFWRNGQVELTLDPTADTRSFLESHARAVEAQAQLVARAPLWYLGPLTVGMLVLVAGRRPPAAAPLGPGAATVGFVASVFLGVLVIQLRAARKLRAQARALRAELD